MRHFIVGLIAGLGIGFCLPFAIPIETASAATQNQWEAYWTVASLCGGGSPWTKSAVCHWRQGPDEFVMYSCGSAYKCWNDGLTHKECAAVGFAGCAHRGSHGTIRISDHRAISVAEYGS